MLFYSKIIWEVRCMTAFSINLRSYREQLGLKSKEFADILGISYSTYLSYENSYREPKYDTLIKIAKALNITTDELLGYTPNADKLTKLKQELASLGFSVSEHEDHIVVNEFKIKDKDYFPIIIEGALKLADRLTKDIKKQCIIDMIHRYQNNRSLLYLMGDTKYLPYIEELKETGELQDLILTNNINELEEIIENKICDMKNLYNEV